MWALLVLRPYLEGARFIVRTDHRALHTDVAHGRRERWRLRLAEFENIVEAHPGQHHHAADVMYRLATSGVEHGPIPDEISTLLALPSFGQGLVHPRIKRDTRYPPMTLRRFLAAQAADARCRKIRDHISRDANSRYGETPNGILVRLAPLHRAAKIIVPKALQRDFMVLEHETGYEGHPGVNKMYASFLRASYWDTVIYDVHAFVA